MLAPALATLAPWMPARVNASVQSSPTCAAGVGVGGVNNATASLTAGGDGCVVIKYSNGATVNYETFNYTGADQTWTVPSGVSSARFFLLGGGGGGVPMAGNYGDGGGGGYAAGTREVTSGEVFTVIVGHGGGGELLTLVSGTGTNGCYRSGFVYGGGGEGASCTSGLAYADRASSGGGRSAIRLANATEIVTAAGGGGGGWTSNGGPGGGTSGGASLDAGGGTQIGGGTTANARATPGAQFTGGNGFHQGGGGGGGFFGGGGGNSISGGGGGSSYIALVGDGVTFAGSGTNPGGEINSLAGNETTCANNAGRGGAVSSTLANTLGGNGCVALKYDDANSTIYETFNYTGADQTWVVPSGVTSVTFFLVGAGGGGATALSHGAGGGGGFTRGTYAVTPGDSLIVIVGQAGGGELGVSGTVGNCLHTRLKYGGGGQGGSCQVGSYAPGSTSYSSGGGRSAIRLLGGTSDIATAGGGGGGGWGSSSNGGGGGGITGIDGGGQGGKGGTQIAGGARGVSGRNNGTAGIAYLGGRGDDESGGGGGGYFGGGGAGDNGGGGGGSSYAALLTNSATVAGSGVNPGGNINTLATADVTPPIVTLAATSSTSTVGTITFTVTGNEAINCSTLSTTAGSDFTFTGITSISAITQTSATVCTITAASTASNDGVAVTSTLTRASTFSIADTAGNAQTALGGSPQSTVVTIPDTIAPIVTFTAVNATAGTRAISFAVTGNEAISCASLSVVNGEDFSFTNISEITSIVQTSPTVCTINVSSTALNGGGVVTSTLTAAAGFSVTDVAGNAQTILSGSPKSVAVTIPIEVPTALSAVSLDGAARISFTMGDDGGTAITNYMYSLNGGAYVVLSPADGTSPITIPGLTNGTTYNIALKAVNAFGISDASSTVTVTPLAVPSAPTNVVATLENAQSTVSWNASINNGGSAILDYVVTASPGGNTCTTPDAATHTCVVTGLTNGTAYTFSVVGRNAVGNSPDSPASLPVTPRTISAAPTNVAGVVGDTESFVSWSAPVNNGGSAILNYVVTASPGGRTCTTQDGATLSCVVTGLTNGTAYTFTVNALNAVGYSPGASSANSVTPAAITAPSRPTSISISVSNGAATLSWSTPASNGGSPITDYLIEYSTDGGTTWEIFNDGVSTTTSASLTGLIGGQSYRFRVKAVNAVGTGIASPSTSAVPIAAVVVPTTSSTSPPVAPSVATPSVVVPVGANVQQNIPRVVAPSTTTSVVPTPAITSPITSPTIPDPKISQLNDLRTQMRDNVGAVSGMVPGGWVKVTPSDTKVVLTTSEGLRIEIGAQKRDARTTKLNSRGMVVVEHGDEITIAGGGLAPNSEASTWFFSTPRLLGILTVDANGAFSERYTIGPEVEPGDHTSQINGLAPDGTLRSVEVAVEVMAPLASPVVPTTKAAVTNVKTNQEPFDPMSDIDGLLSLFATALVLTAVAGSSQAGRKRDEEREAAELSEVSVSWGATGLHDQPDRLAPRSLRWLDSFSLTTPLLFARRVPVFARICADGSYLRAILGGLWLVMPLLAVVVGIAGAQSTGGEMLMPALWVLVALLVLGIFDAFAGLISVATFGVLVLVQGGFSSSDSLRGFLGLLVFGFAVALVASATRPFRRKPSDEVTTWVRVNDIVLLPLFGAWAAGGMFSALPGLTGFSPSFADRTTLIQVIALVALLGRFVAENAAQQLVPTRLRSIENEILPAPSVVQQLLSLVVRTLVFVFIASVFVGNNWALWVGAAMYMLPKVVGLVDDKFPNLALIHKFLPRALFKVVVMIFLARWWGTTLSSMIDDSEQVVQLGFILAGLPGVILAAIGWFARDSKQWPSTVLTKTMGIVLVAVGFLTVQGFIF